MKRILSLILIVLLLTTIATPALAAKAKPSIIPTTLWAKCDYFESVRFRNMPEKAKLISIKSSNTKVIKVVKEGSGIYDNYLEPLKAGKAKITVKYKIGSKSNTISATYTVKKYPNPLQSVEVNGAKVNITELLALNIYSTYNINKNWHGVAQAKAVVFFLLVAVLAIAQQSATRSKEVQQ